MSLRTLFIAAFVTFAAVVSAGGGYLAWREASDAVEEELDRRATWIAGAAAETGLQASLLVGLEPGFEDEMAWTLTRNRLLRLRRYVPEAYIVREDNTALVSTHPADSVPIGTPLRFLDAFQAELDSARALGNATTPAFEGTDGQLYKWGFAQLEQSELALAVLMPADYLAPLASLRRNLLLGSGLASLLAAVMSSASNGGFFHTIAHNTGNRELLGLMTGDAEVLAAALPTITTAAPTARWLLLGPSRCLGSHGLPVAHAFDGVDPAAPATVVELEPDDGRPFEPRPTARGACSATTPGAPGRRSPSRSRGRRSARQEAGLRLPGRR